MQVKPIKSEADYDASLPRIEGLMGAAPSTPASDELRVIVALVEAYEAAHWPIAPPDSNGTIKRSK